MGPILGAHGGGPRGGPGVAIAGGKAFRFREALQQKKPKGRKSRQKQQANPHAMGPIWGGPTGPTLAEALVGP